MTTIDGSHVVALCCGFVIGYALCRILDAYREVSDDDLAPIPYRSLPPRSVPPASYLARVEPRVVARHLHIYDQEDAS